MPTLHPEDVPDIDNPFLTHLGATLVALSPGYAEFQLELEPKHLNRQMRLHGGTTASLLDAACGYAGLYTGPNEPIQDSKTLMLSVSYVSSLSNGILRACGKVTGGGHKIYFAEASLLTDDGQLVATATGTFKRVSIAA